jgi:hypothetical protein
MADLKQRQSLQKKGQALPPSQSNQSDAPRFPITQRTGKDSLASAIKAVGRARPNTPEEHAKIRRYIKKVARAKGWGKDIPDSWNGGSNA